MNDLKKLVADYYTIKKNEEFEEVVLANKQHQEIGSEINKLCKELNVSELKFNVDGEEHTMTIKVVEKKTVKDINLVPKDNIIIKQFIVKQFD